MQRKTAIVTGASSGIGRETAIELARRGYAVLLAARRAGRLEQVASACDAAGGRGVAAPTDVADRGQVDALVARAVDQFGRLDVMVNNAGYGLHAAVHETTERQMRALFDVNYHGVFFGSAAAAKAMVPAGGGHIFNVSSVIGKRGAPFNGAYCATKFAICGLTDSLRVELAPRGVCVTCVCPALTETGFFEAMEDGGASAGETMRSLRGLTPPRVVARKIAATVGKPTPELVFTAGGKLLTLIAAISPRLADAMMARYRDATERDRRGVGDAGPTT